MSNLKYYKCDKCDYGTYYVQNYNQHLKSKKHLNIGKQKEYKCDKCDKLFNNWSNWYQHKKSHIPNKYSYIKNLKIINEALNCDNIDKDDYFKIMTFKQKYEAEYKKLFPE